MSAKLGNEALAGWMRGQMAASPYGEVTFRQFMEWCLYHPSHGYYVTTRPKVGKAGDFYTSSAIGGVMGNMLARELACLAGSFGWESWDLVEWGGGTGQLAGQVLDTLRSDYPDQYRRLTYCPVEVSGYHRSLLEERLAPHAAIVSPRTHENWRREGRPDRTIVLSNELLDAFPVHRIKREGGEWLESWVAWEEAESRFAEVLRPCADAGLLSYVERCGIALRDEQWAECNVEAESWIRGQAEWLEEGAIVTVDYGDTAGELYAAHRMKGTLIGYWRHQAQDRPLELVGDQDLTSHVNFSACIRAGREGGITEESLRTQKQFLVDNGVLQLLADHADPDPFSPVARRNRAIRQLLLSDQMSELFKVLVQTKTRRSSIVNG